MTASAADLAFFRDAFEQRTATLPEPQRRARAAQLEAFLRRGFPRTREEDWRYTDLSPVSAHPLVNAQVPALAALRTELEPWFLPGADRLVFVNGHFAPELSVAPDGALLAHSQAPEPVEALDDEPISQLNAALASDGAVIRIPARTQYPRPIQLLHYSVPGEGTMAHLAHRICLEPSAEATLVVQNVGRPGGRQFLTHTAMVRLLPGARLKLARVQEEGDGVQSVSQWDCLVERDAHLEFLNVDLGGGLVRNDLNVRLEAAGAEVALHGLFAPADRAHVDNHVRIDHRAPHGTSRQVYRGIVGERAKAVFNGRVIVRPGAQKTDSDQQVASLLLGAGAEVNAKPELEIHADDVKCTHGATAGQIDEQAIYYLRSRGIAEETARNLLLYTFAHEVLGRLTPEPLRRQVEQRLFARLPGGVNLEALA